MRNRLVAIESSGFVLFAPKPPTSGQMSECQRSPVAGVGATGVFPHLSWLRGYRPAAILCRVRAYGAAPHPAMPPLAGGWYCFDKENCGSRYETMRRLMSSTKWPQSKTGKRGAERGLPISYSIYVAFRWRPTQARWHKGQRSQTLHRPPMNILRALCLPGGLCLDIGFIRDASQAKVHESLTVIR